MQHLATLGIPNSEYPMRVVYAREQLYFQDDKLIVELTVAIPNEY
jgi:hypothetical protein